MGAHLRPVMCIYNRLLAQCAVLALLQLWFCQRFHS